ncbi:MAG: lipase family protein [Synechococcaceae cyanobacterium]|nr:lipase family protein [Synechococcaceae cyanobacterium]
MRVQPTVSSLEAANAYWMARLSRSVYRASGHDRRPDEGAILAELRAEDPGFLSITGVSRHSAQAILVEHRDYLAISFRGTDELLDWLDNLNALTVQAPFGPCHRGFLHSVLDLWEPVQDRFRELHQQHPRGLFLTGHSLGGAMATVAGALLLHHGIPFTAAYTFGQPRALTADSARHYHRVAGSRTFRFQNNNDLISRAPTRLLGFTHVGTLLSICDRGLIHREAPPRRRRQPLRDLRRLGLEAVRQHGMDRYLEAVGQWQLVQGEARPWRVAASEPEDEPCERRSA